ncbi:hypothetical protein L681_20925 [Stenotrophomonas maltophilia MF89]|nr:hypothetical protein L681_20925 [Stenotrophomonas maltophilia MF89]
MDFTNYNTRSRYAKEINAGYSAHLAGVSLDFCPFDRATNLEKRQAWQHGWDLADDDHYRQGRPADVV